MQRVLLTSIIRILSSWKNTSRNSIVSSLVTIAECPSRIRKNSQPLSSVLDICLSFHMYSKSSVLLVQRLLWSKQSRLFSMNPLSQSNTRKRVSLVGLIYLSFGSSFNNFSTFWSEWRFFFDKIGLSCYHRSVIHYFLIFIYEYSL